MKNLLATGATALVALAILTFVTFAQQASSDFTRRTIAIPTLCASSIDVLMEKLRGSYGEDTVVKGRSHSSITYRLVVSAMKTWTFIGIDGKGEACIVAAGDKLEFVRPEFPATSVTPESNS